MPLLADTDIQLARCPVVPKFTFESSIARFGCRLAKKSWRRFFATVGAAVSFLTLKKKQRNKENKITSYLTVKCVHRRSLFFPLLRRSPDGSPNLIG